MSLYDRQPDKNMNSCKVKHVPQAAAMNGFCTLHVSPIESQSNSQSKESLSNKVLRIRVVITTEQLSQQSKHKCMIM